MTNASSFLMAAISDGVVVQLITSVTSIAAIVLAWLTQRKWRKTVNRKAPRAHPKLNGRLAMIAAMAGGALLAIPVVWIAWNGGKGLDAVQKLGMTWVALVLACLSILQMGVSLYQARTFGQYSESNTELVEALDRQFEGQRLLAQSYLTITERLDEHFNKNRGQYHPKHDQREA